MTRVANYRILNPVFATTREIAEVVNRTTDGKLNSTGEFTIASGTTTTSVTDPRASKESIVLFAGIGNTLIHSEPFMSSRANGSFVVGHLNHGHDVLVGYVIIG